MNKKWLAAVPILAIFLFGTYRLGVIEAWQPDPISVQGLLEATNKERAKVGVKPLILDERLNQSANKKVVEIVSTQNYSHVNANGVHGYSYVFEVIEGCRYASENINNDSPSNGKAVESWMDSPSHREAILDERYEIVGFSHKNGFVVQHFCDIE